MNKIKFLILILLVIVLAGCIRLNPNIRDEDEKSLLHTAITVVEIMKDKDWVALSNYIHEEQGVRFSPYAFIDLDNHLVFSKDQISKLNKNNETYEWGQYSGTGDPIRLTFDEYYKKFIFDLDFSNPNLISNNVIIKTGNMVNNIKQIYTTSRFVEFHFTGINLKYEGADWRSLRIVFEKHNNEWYIIGIVHDEWTI